MREPFLLPLAAIAGGIVLGRWLGFTTFDAAWPVLAFASLAMAARSWLRGVCVALAMLMLGALAVSLHRQGSPPVIDAGSREVVLVEGCVVEPSVLAPQREQFTLELAPGARVRVMLPLESPLDGTPPVLQRLDYGQRVEIAARLRSPRNFQNPGAFDYAGYLARRDIFWNASMERGSPARILPGRCGSRVTAWLYGIRGAALDCLAGLYAGDDYTTGMMQAILLGETSRLEKIWTENFRRTGTIHALVISGAHVAVLAGVLLFLLRLCALPEIAALALTAAAAWLYALVSGFSPPVARAAAGFTLYLAARFFFRRTRPLNLLAAIAIVYLLCDPGELFDASFQLSFLSVAALSALALPFVETHWGPLARGLRGIAQSDADAHLEPRAAQLRVEIRLLAETLHLWLRLPLGGCLELLALAARAAFWAADLALVSVAIQVGLALPMAEYFHRISFTGLTANLIIVPLLEIAVPVGFLAIFSGWHWAAALGGGLLQLAARTAAWHADWEPSWRIADPPLWLALGLVTALLGLALSLRHVRWRWRAGVAVLGLFALLLGQPWRAQTTAGVLELTAIDVGQGDSLLLVLPQGQRMLIDGGGVLQYGRQRRTGGIDTGEDVVSPYLWSRGIRRVDIIAATHAHEDHSGGLAALLENFRPRELWVGTNPAPALLEGARKLGMRVVFMTEGPEFAYGGASLQVLSPSPDVHPPKAGNNDSLVLHITYGRRSFLLTGDLESVQEQRLLLSGRPLHADVLKVGHHGSRTSTGAEFLAAVAPSVALISAGFDNSFGHPHADVLTRLGARGVAILRTDRDGWVAAATDGRDLLFDGQLWHPASAVDVFKDVFRGNGPVGRWGE